MSEMTNSKVHWSYWAIAAFALIWNVLGSVNYIMQMNPDIVTTLPETHQAIISGRPAWATGGFAIGVFGGALGGILLLLRQPAALYVFVVSLIGVLITMIHTVRVANSVISFSASEVIVMIILPVVVAGLLVWHSTRARFEHS